MVMGIVQTLQVGSLPVTPPIALAPMVGLSHSALRSLVQEEGGVGLLYSEMLTVKRLPHDNPRCSPLLARSTGEWPLFYQLVAAGPEHLAAAVDTLHSLDAQGIDLNLGCPAPMVRKMGAGTELVADRPTLLATLRLLRRRTTLPLTVKIRLGRNLDIPALQELCRTLAGEGVDLLTVHARLDGEKFCRKPRWQAVAAVREVVDLPILANGGIFSVADARRCLAESGADGLMLGRGAVTRPWLPAAIAREVYGLPVAGSGRTPTEVYFRFSELLGERFAPERQLGRLKQFTQYFAAVCPFGHHLAAAIQSSTGMAEALARATAFFAGISWDAAYRRM